MINATQRLSLLERRQPVHLVDTDEEIVVDITALEEAVESCRHYQPLFFEDLIDAGWPRELAYSLRDGTVSLLDALECADLHHAEA